MVVNVGCLELLLAQKLNTVGAATSNIDLLMYARAIQQMKTGAVWTVATFSSLPDAAVNVGKLYFVSDTQELFWSNGVYGWVSMFPGSVSRIWSWGLNNCGQLGEGTVTPRSSPGTTSGGGNNWCMVSASIGFHTTALKANGSAWTWGCNYCGALGDGTVTHRSSPGTLAGGGTTWCRISAGDAHSAAIKTDGTAWTWGGNSNGQLGNSTVIARSSPGTTAGGGTNWRQISSGTRHNAAIKTDGTVWTWGLNSNGELGDGSVVAKSSPVLTAGGGTTWCQISAARFMTAAIKTDGTAWTWGYNNFFGQLGDGTTVNRSSPVTPAGGGTNWCQISMGNSKTAALKTDGTAWTWGWNNTGSLGDGTVTDRCSPGLTAGAGTTWCRISAGAAHMAAVKTDGTTWSWGRNNEGQLADGTAVARSSPVLAVGGITSWCNISAGNTQTIAIQSITL